MPAEVTLVVPCWNEQARFDPEGFGRLLEDERVRLLFVDDGSTDATRERLAAFAAQSAGRAELLALPRNVGKAEAVRAGMQAALRDGAEIVGFIDADLATPPSEILRLVAVMRERPLQALLGARVALAGRDIERTRTRHYLGRVFATAASIALRAPVYDTQCGAKLFRRGAALDAALEAPFISRWVFDVELIGRLLIGTRTVPPVPIAQIAEEPLRVWRAVEGSKLRPRHFVQSAIDLARIEHDLAQRRAAAGRRDG